MKIPLTIFAVFLSALLATVGGVCAWTLTEVIDMKADIAAIKTQLNINHPTIAEK